MAAAQAPLIPELEQALRGISAEKHGETVRRVTDFFVAGASRFNELHVRLFDRILARLIPVLESKSLAELARRLAPVPNAPPDVIRQLAYDNEIAVAAPVLSRSTCINDVDLVEIASSKSQAHLLAISGRASVSEVVTDALVEHGDRDVARNVAMNHGARFSQSGMERLAARAANDGILAEKLGQRQDLPPHEFRNLLLTATMKCRERLLAVAPPEIRAEIEDLVADVSRNVADAAEQAEAWRLVSAMKRNGRLEETQVLELAECGRDQATIAALALMCDVSVDVLRRLMGGDQPDAALILCQAAAFSWPTARAILQAASQNVSPAGDSAFAALQHDPEKSQPPA